ncbi:endonuclease/exonuclease/phosphatase [Xylariaceae sp. FL1651]|nr:endonuclease/exonuclease/phosphatase [Xylariaceae sp. FL1651]
MHWRRIFTTTSLMAAAPTSIATAAAVDALDLRIITFNVRYAAPASTYERPWSVRGPLLIAQVAAAAASATAHGAVPVVGMQEVLHAQLLDVAAGLGPDWSHLGTGRDDGAEAGEYCPLFYQPAVVTLLASTQKWLSPTPDVPSFWPGAGSRRYVLVAVFEHAATGTRFIVANTHLDNQSGEARAEGAKIALGVIRDAQASWGPGLPVTLSGDFNSEPGGDAYAAMVADGYLQDLYAIAPQASRFGPYETYTGFVPAEIPDVAQRIDFIWAGPNATATWDVERYEVLDNVVDGVFVSDHRAVVGDIKLKT